MLGNAAVTAFGADEASPGSVSRSRPPKPDMRCRASGFPQASTSTDERLAFGTFALEKRVRIREHQRVLQDFVHVLDLDQRDVLQHLLRNFVDVLLVFLG